MFLPTTLLGLSTLAVVASAATVNLTALFGPHLSSGAEIFLPSSSNYTEDITQRWTTWEAPTFIGAIKPATEADVQNIVKIAVSNDIPFLATGGGHGFSLGFANITNAIDIDLGNFNTVRVDASNNILTVGGSVRFQDVYQALYDVGKEIQNANSPCTGMIGVTLGAGVGPLQGLHGLVLDALKSVHLVTASGELITVSSTENADLFWALRGAGANFGIITSANYTIHDATNNGQLINADFIYPAAANRSLFTLLASFDDYIPPELALGIEMLYNHTSQEPLLVASVIYYGTQADAQPYLDQFTALNPAVSEIANITWPELQEGSSAGCTPGVFENVYTIGLGQTDVPTFESVFSDLAVFSAAHPTYNGVLAFQRYSNVVSSSMPENETVYPWRNIKTQGLFLNTLLDSSINAEVDTFMQSVRADLQNTSGFPCLEVYINYSHGDEGPWAWYGEWNLLQLAVLKEKWDPQNLFTGGHAIF